jgi:hypothetical protein
MPGGIYRIIYAIQTALDSALQEEIDVSSTMTKNGDDKFH